MNYSKAKEEVILPCLSVFARPKFVLFASATVVVSYMNPCTKILLSSFIMPCNESSTLQDVGEFTMSSWFWEIFRIIAACLEGLWMQQLVVLCSISTISGNLYCATIINRVLCYQRRLANYSRIRHF